MTARLFLAAGALVLAAALASVPADAHITVVSQYTFTEHVHPILQERCGACHGDAGIGMPLLQYDQARRQNFAIQQSLLAARMPPWSAEPGAVAFKEPQSLTPRELDILMTWAAGGTPEGPAGHNHVMDSAGEWPLGTPDLVLEMPAPFTLDPSQTTAVHEVVLPAGAARGRSIRMADLMPGTPEMVQRAEVVIRRGRVEQTVALWVPGDRPQPLELSAGYAMPRDGVFVLRVHYRRAPGQAAALTDRSRLGVYLSTGVAQNLREMVVTGDGPWNAERVFTQPVTRNGRAVALRPISGPEDAVVRLVLVSPNGARKSLARLQIRAAWPRRYALAAPLVLPRGSTLEARVTRRDVNLWATLTGEAGYPAREDSLRLSVEIVD